MSNEFLKPEVDVGLLVAENERLRGLNRVKTAVILFLSAIVAAVAVIMGHGCA